MAIGIAAVSLIPILLIPRRSQSPAAARSGGTARDGSAEEDGSREKDVTGRTAEGRAAGSTVDRATGTP